MGVAERNLGTAIQLVSGHLGRQIAQWAASPFGMATIAVAGITLITSAIEKNSQKLEENAQKAGEAYDKVKQNMNELDDLIKQYNELQISNEWNNTPVEAKKQLHEDINKLLGDEADKVDILNGKYKETTEELFKQRMSKLPEEEKKAFDNEQAKGKSLWDTAYWNGGGGAGGYNYGTMQATDSEKKFIEKYEKIFDEKWYSAGDMAASDYVIRFDNFDDFMMKYEEAKKMLQELYDEGMGESDLYKGLNSFIAKFDTKVGEYKTAVEELESTKAGQKLADYINTSVGGYVDDLDEYKIVVDWIKSNFTGKDADNALGLLNSYFSEYAEKVSKTNEMLGQEGLSIQLSDLEGASDKIGKLSSAFKELSDDGYITTKTLGEIKEATGLSDDEWEQYQTKLMNAKAGSAEFNQVMSDLTYKIVENAFAGKDLTDVTEDQIAAVLRENGVVNANAVAHDIATKAKAKEKAKGFELCDSIDVTKAKLIEEAKSCGISTAAYAQLVAQETIFNNNTLDISDKVAKLASLQQSLGQTTSMAIGLNNALAGRNLDDRLEMAMAIQQYGIKTTGKGYEYNGVVYKSGQDAVNAAMMGDFSKNLKIDIKPLNVDYSGNKSKDKSGSSSKSDDPSWKDPYDAIVNRINLRATELKQDEELINSKLDLIDTETEYAEAIKLTNSLISNQKLRKEELIKANNQISHEAQYLRDSNPYDEDLWFNSQGEATEAYYSLLNSVGTGTEQEKIETLFKQIQKYKKAYLENEKEIRDVDKDIFENTKKVSDYARNALEKQFKERTENSERWISTEESLDKLNTKEKLAAYKRIIAYHDDFLKQIETDENPSAKDRDELWKEYYDQREDYAIKAYETEREIVDNVSSELERIISLETKNLQRKNEELDKSLTKEQKILEIMNSRYDILDKLAEAEHEADKAILESRRSKEYLSPAEYNLLFNEEDYLETKDKIKTLRNESEKLSLDFTAQINKAYAENNLYLAEAITSEYQRQLALKERELEILQREIDLEKKQQQLNNVLAEKNVKFLNKQGQWEWVADLDKVNQAEEDLADAKYVYDKAVEEKNKQLAINLQEGVISNIETSMGENDKKIQELEDTIELITEKVDLLQNPIQDITGLVTELASKGIAGMNAALGDLVTMLSEVTGVQYDIPSYIPTSYQLLESTSDLKNVTSLYASEKPQTTFNGVTFDKNFDYQDLINKEKALDYPDSFKLMELMKKREAKLAWIKEYGLSGYALGTKKAQPGLSWVDESGQETYVTSHGVLHNFIGGEMVFNPEQTKNLWELSNIDYSKMFSPQIINMDSLSFKKPEVQNRSYFEGANINVYNPADFNDFMRQMNDTIKNKKV